MAKVQVQVTGGMIQQKEAETIADLKKLVNADKYMATVNGEKVDDDHVLSNFEFVAFTEQVKGA